jgi:hypothetical protein
LRSYQAARISRWLSVVDIRFLLSCAFTTGCYHRKEALSILAQGAGLRLSRAWLREHAAEYRGQWVAVREGTLLGAAESLAALKSQARQELDPVTA